MAERLKIRRALFTAADKRGLDRLAQSLAKSGTEIVATGKTAQAIEAAGVRVVPIERVSGSPEAFQGRMKTLSFPVCSGILYRRGDAKDEADLANLGIQPIDCVVVNFYPFEEAAVKPGITREALIEEVDIGGPTLVRAAAKNAPDVLVLTDPAQYDQVIAEMEAEGSISPELANRCAEQAWRKIQAYDDAIAARLAGETLALRYGENPHQKASLEFDHSGPIEWGARLTATELSYNNILDLSAAYALASDLASADLNGARSTGVVIVKHNNPCGVAQVPGTDDAAQLRALELAWAGDPVSAFGGVLVFTRRLGEPASRFLASRFVECIAAPELTRASLTIVTEKRKNLKAVPIRRFGELPPATVVTVPGGTLRQTPDVGLAEPLRAGGKTPWPARLEGVARFGIAVCRSLKSNAIALVRSEADGAFQLVGAGQGQPNRIEALEKLAVPRARGVLANAGGTLADCVLVSDAFFPFRDTVEAAHHAGIRFIVQPGGSIKDAESIAAADGFGIAMAMTGIRHFRH